MPPKLNATPTPEDKLRIILRIRLPDHPITAEIAGRADWRISVLTRTLEMGPVTTLKKANYLVI